MFLWNFWWMRRGARRPGSRLTFTTAYLFHPDGVDLVLHSHTLLNAFVGATVLGSAPLRCGAQPDAARELCAQRFLTYLLACAYANTGRRPCSPAPFLPPARPSSPAPVRPLQLYSRSGGWSAEFVVALAEALDRRRLAVAVVDRMLLAVVAYADYYYFVYASTFAACVLAWRWLGVGMRRSTWTLPARADHVIAAIAAAAATAAIAIAATGGLVATFGALRISLKSGTNLRALATAAALWWLWRRWRPALDRPYLPSPHPARPPRHRGLVSNLRPAHRARAGGRVFRVAGRSVREPDLLLEERAGRDGSRRDRARQPVQRFLGTADHAAVCGAGNLRVRRPGLVRCGAARPGRDPRVVVGRDAVAPLAPGERRVPRLGARTVSAPLRRQHRLADAGNPSAVPSRSCRTRGSPGAP